MDRRAINCAQAFRRKHVPGRTQGHQLTIREEGHPIGETRREIQVVEHRQHAITGTRPVSKGLQQRHTVSDVEIGRGLVEKQPAHRRAYSAR